MDGERPAEDPPGEKDPNKKARKKQAGESGGKDKAPGRRRRLGGRARGRAGWRQLGGAGSLPQ